MRRGFAPSEGFGSVAAVRSGVRGRGRGNQMARHRTLLAVVYVSRRIP